MVRRFVSQAIGIALVFVAVLAQPVGAQTGSGSIAGVAKDTSGAVLPGVTVEAASPALIEKVRTAVTDGEGRYNIVDLRPGAYTVTFTLTGFNTFKRDGIELTANTTATVNGDLRVGALEETITVSGQAPVVDTQSAVQQSVFTRDLLDNLPANRNYSRVLGAQPAARGVQDVGGTSGEYLTPGNAHGSAVIDTSYKLDGMLITGGYSVGGANNMFYLNNGSIQEMTVEISGMSAESMLGGMHFNAVPKEGSNNFNGVLVTNFANHSMQGNNVTPDLLARGLRDPNSLDKVWDLNPVFGGPIKKDKLWFFWGNRFWGTYSAVAGNYYNKTPNSNRYTADLDKQAQWRQYLTTTDFRLTWQAAQKHKINVFWGGETDNFKDGLTTGGAVNGTPETIATILFNPNYIAQATWSYPATNRLLLQAGGTAAVSRIYAVPQPENVNAATSVYTLQEQSTAYTIQGLTGQFDRRSNNYNYRASASYVTGTHAFKTGVVLQQGWTVDSSQSLLNFGSISLRMNNGIPNQVTMFADPRILIERLKANMGLYVQDKWTLKKLTLSGGIRYDWLNAYVPPQFLAAGRFVAARSFAQVNDVPNWKDLSPRMGGVYDLFGNGRTAIKANLGRFPIGNGTTGPTRQNNPVQTTVNSANRAWTDNGAGGGIAGDFVPQCNFTNFAANGECGVISNQGFGGVQILTSFADGVRTGFNVRAYNWEGSVGVNHELTRGLGLGVAYFRRWFGNQQATQNTLAPTLASYDPFCVTAPTDPLLRDVSGQQICGLMNVKPAVFNLVNNVVYPVSQFGKVTETFNGVDLTVNARFPGGATLNGGLAVGKSLFDACEVLAKGAQVAISGTIDLNSGVTSAPSTVFCHQETPWLNQVKIFGVYPLPWQFQVSANFQSIPGPVITASYAALSTDIVKTLGRPVSGGGSTVTVNLISPGTQYDTRINQLDVRFTRTFRVGRRRIQGMLDVFNALNGNYDTSITTTYGPKYLYPTRILTARMVKVGAQVNF